MKLASAAALYTLTLRQYLHGKRWIVMGALALLPMGLCIWARAVSPLPQSTAAEFIFCFMFIPQGLLPLLALIYASGMMQDEQEEQTLTYLLIRPIPKWAIYLLKLLATLTATVALTALFTILTYAALYVRNKAAPNDVLLRCREAVAIHSLAVIAYCCLFGLISLLSKRTLVVGILYTAIVEGLFANLPFGIRLITVIYYTRIIAYRTMSFVMVNPWGREDFAANAWQLDLANDPGLAQHPQRLTCILILLSASAVFAAAGAIICWRKEFHVKTPEKG